MRRLFIAVAVVLPFALAHAQAPQQQSGVQEDRLVPISSADAEMKVAIREARASLPDFWKSLANPTSGESGFALKVAISDGKLTEHFWLVNVDRKGSKLSGTISNTPEWVKTVQYGQRHEFKEDRITDWTFKRNGKIVGNRTGRALMKLMPKEEAELFRQMFEKP